MDIKQAIADRRSIRKYQNKKVSDDIIEDLLDAARLAPSGNNTQPCKYVVIKNDDVKQNLKEQNIFLQNFVYDAPVTIVCCTDPNAYKKRNEDLDDANNMRAIRDLSIASAFIVLQATELGLGTCYVGWLEKEKIKDILDIPKEYIIPYVITVGYADETPSPRDRKSLDEITF